MSEAKPDALEATQYTVDPEFINILRYMESVIPREGTGVLIDKSVPVNFVHFKIVNPDTHAKLHVCALPNGYPILAAEQRAGMEKITERWLLFTDDASSNEPAFHIGTIYSDLELILGADQEATVPEDITQQLYQAYDNPKGIVVFDHHTDGMKSASYSSHVPLHPLPRR